jgi:DnaK suppressor protein
MNKTKLKKIKSALISEKDRIIKTYYHKSNDIDNDGDEVDEIQANLINYINSNLSSRDAYKVKQINIALQKIEDNTFGICEDCENEIPEKRLMINPCFPTCVECAEDREKNKK